ncbi:MAG: AraC family transcriptional regulator [Calditrichaeota bacterium]|nr:MAG: AraC family transcriptional regulator [Calditrichota bacterium]
MNAISEKIHWTDCEEMLFSEQHKYALELPEDFPLLIKFYRFDALHPILPNYHDFYEIGCVYSGEAVYHIAGHNFSIQAGNVVFIQSGQMHTIDAGPYKPLMSASIYFKPELISHIGAHPLENNYLLPFTGLISNRPPILQQKDLGVSIWQYILDMYKESCDVENFYQLAIKNRLCDILLISLRAMKRLNMIKRAQAPQNKINRLTIVLDYIQRHYAESIALGHLAKLAFMSSSYFCRYFKQVVGLSPINYILRYRIDKAKQLLLTTNLTHSEVSFQVGFSSQSYFNRIFQRFTKMNPKNFLRMYENAVQDKTS